MKNIFKQIEPNKKIYLFLFVFVVGFTFVSSKLSIYFDVPTPQGTNQFFAVGLLFFLWEKFGRKLSIPATYKSYLRYLILYIVVSFFFRNGTMGSYAVGFLMTLLFVPVFVVSFNLKLTVENFLWLLRNTLFLIIGLISVIGYEVFLEGNGFRQTASFFKDQAIAAGGLSCALILGISLFLITDRKIYLILSFYISGLIVASTFKKTFISMAIIWALFFLWGKNKRKSYIYISVFLIFFSGMFSIFGQKLVSQFSNIYEQYQLNSENVVRFVLLKTGFDIAVDHFPFGSGFGTFASVPSATNYSSVYSEYGLNNIWGLNEDSVGTSHYFLLDCYWAHIIGELGFVGTFLFLLVWIYPASSIYFMRKKFLSHNISRGISFFIIVTCLILTIEGFSNYYIENVPFILIHSGLVGIGLRVLMSYKKSQKNG